MEGRFIGREIIEKPTCPFCGAFIERPRELVTRMPHEMPLGSCPCGAVYAFDVTGHNLGTAMVEALVFGCNGDWDLAWGLLPEEDYLEGEVKNYDIETHLIVHGAAYQGRNISGTLYFIRLHEDVLEVTEEGFRRELERATPVQHPEKEEKRQGKSLTKREVESLVEDYDVEALLGIADTDRRLIRHLQRLLYAVDPLLRLKAAEILGMVSSRIAQRDPGTISRLLQGYFTSLTDTAASSWGAVDAIGEIIRHSPEQFAGFIPQLYQLTRERTLVPAILRALGRIAARRPDLIRKTAFHYIPLLKDPDPQIRGYAAILLGNLGAREAKIDLEQHTEDQETLEIYGDGLLHETTVGSLAAGSLDRL